MPSRISIIRRTQITQILLIITELIRLIRLIRVTRVPQISSKVKSKKADGKILKYSPDDRGDGISSKPSMSVIFFATNTRIIFY